MSPRWSRSRRAVIVATTVALAALVQPAAAQARVVTGTPPLRAAAVPFAPAPGSYLALVDKGPNAHEDAGVRAKTERLVLVTQSGSVTTLFTTKVKKSGFTQQLRDWSADGTTALLVLPTRRGETVTRVGVPTGVTQTLKVKGDVDATFLDPDGAGIVVAYLTNSRKGLETWARISWAGVVTSLPGKVYGTFLPGPGESVLTTDNGSAHDLLLRSLVDGSLTRTLPTHGYCTPVRWWSASQVLMTCGRKYDLWLLDPATGTTSRLTSQHGRNDFGHLDARQVTSGLYVQIGGPCGYTFVGHQTPSGKIKTVHVPHATGNVVMIDATASDLVLEHQLSCDGARPRGVLSLFDPVARSESPFFTIGRHEQFSTVLTFGNVLAQI